RSSVSLVTKSRRFPHHLYDPTILSLEGTTFLTASYDFAARRGTIRLIIFTQSSSSSSMIDLGERTFLLNLTRFVLGGRCRGFLVQTLYDFLSRTVFHSPCGDDDLSGEVFS